MVQLHFGNGVRRISADNQADTSMPIFLDDRHRVIEVPSRWIMSIAQKASRANETLHQYSYIMNRYLEWLDQCGYSAHGWAMVDEDIFAQYIEYLCAPGVDGNSIRYYCARIRSFYKWASENGYRHFFDLDVENINGKVEVALKNQLLLAHIKPAITFTKLNFETPTGKPALHEKEVEKFVTEPNHRIALSLMDDIVYQVIATIIWITGLRPRDLFQLPYRGKDENRGFIPYDADEIPDDLVHREITFFFRSKGKHRSIEFPGALWRVICERYIPLRRERAELYFQKYKISPNNNTLFLTRDGEVVDYDRLRYAFGKVVPKSRSIPAEAPVSRFSGTKYKPSMLRHSCATYFVYEHLKQQKLLGKPYLYDPTVDDKLRRMLGHEDVETTYKYYVHLVNRFHNDDLLIDLKRSQVNQGLNALLESMNY